MLKQDVRLQAGDPTQLTAVIEAYFSLIKDSFFTEVTGWENR